MKISVNDKHLFSLSETQKKVIKNDFKKLEVVSFEYPIEALDYIKAEYSFVNRDEPSILLLDLNMPIISGWQFLEEYSEFSDTIKNNFIIYILSSSISETDKARAAENKYVKGYIEKPFNSQTCKSMILNYKLQLVL